MEILWALDLDAGGLPRSACCIVDPSSAPAAEAQWPEHLTAACGRVFTAANHPRGWWSRPPGELPLAASGVHCVGGVAPRG